MKTTINRNDWQGVFAVPPLARKRDAARSFDWTENRRIVDHIQGGGVTRLLYGGNAFLYHLSLVEYEQVLDWLSSLDDALWCIPSAGPSFGRLMDQAAILKRYKFPTVMHLPCADPRDAEGLEAGLTEFSQRAGVPLVLYLKDEHNFGSDPMVGLDAVGRLAQKGICVGIKYAVVRDDPAKDKYLEALLERVDRSIIMSGIGERPAIVHMQKFGLPGYTTGSGCIGAAATQAMFELCANGKFDEAAPIREQFIPLEDLRDAMGPARVLHAAIELAGIARTGAVPPFVTEIGKEHLAEIAQSAQLLNAVVV
jgi:dihydrodipicolinate synthase/N-acetylneuraminate lyase